MAGAGIADVAMLAIALLLGAAIATGLARARAQGVLGERKTAAYDGFMAVMSQIMAGRIDGETGGDARARFADAANRLSLIASDDALVAMRRLCEELSEANRSNFSAKRYDRFLSDFVWHARRDVGVSPGVSRQRFAVRLWASRAEPPEQLAE